MSSPIKSNPLSINKEYVDGYGYNANVNVVDVNNVPSCTKRLRISITSGRQCFLDGMIDAKDLVVLQEVLEEAAKIPGLVDKKNTAPATGLNPKVIPESDIKELAGLLDWIVRLGAAGFPLPVSKDVVEKLKKTFCA